MANRLMANRQYTFERDVKTIFAHVTIGAVGAPTLDGPNSLGVLSITRNGVGDYTVVFGTQVNGVNVLDPYYQFLFAELVLKPAATPAASNDPILVVKAINTGDPTLASLRFQLLGLTAGAFAAVELANGDELYLRFTFSDSSAA